MTELTIDPATQYQGGDLVIYITEGVVAQVIGYKWAKGPIPKITGYHLHAAFAFTANT